MHVSVIQNDPIFGLKEKNLEQCLNMMQQVKADLYVLPELFSTGYNFIDKDELRQLAEPFMGGYTFQRIREFASQNKCFIVYGFPELNNNKIFNSAGLVGFDGTFGLFRKVHLFDREKLYFTPGDQGFQVFETSIGKIGIMICFDWYFPESARTLALKEAQIIAHPANLVLPNCPDCMVTRCLENRMFAATANRIGTEDRGGHSLHFIGKSQIVTPKGQILGRASHDHPEIIVAEVDLSMADNKNLTPRNHLLKDRRKDAYHL